MRGFLQLFGRIFVVNFQLFFSFLLRSWAGAHSGEQGTEENKPGTKMCVPAGSFPLTWVKVSDRYGKRFIQSILPVHRELMEYTAREETATRQ